MAEISRRGLITGLVSFLAAPAIVRAASLDVIRGKPLNTVQDGWFLDELPEYQLREVSLGYTITRERIESALTTIRNAGLAPWLNEQDELRILEVTARNYGRRVARDLAADENVTLYGSIGE